MVLLTVPDRRSRYRSANVGIADFSSSFTICLTNGSLWSMSPNLSSSLVMSFASGGSELFVPAKL